MLVLDFATGDGPNERKFDCYCYSCEGMIVTVRYYDKLERPTRCRYCKTKYAKVRPLG